MTEVTNCPQCPRHCPVDELNCERGKAYFEGEESQTERNWRVSKHGKHGRSGYGHEKHMPIDKSSLYGLIHALVHKSDETSELFSALSDEEQEQLKILLSKLIGN